MLTDAEIRMTGVDALLAALGEVQTEKFIAMLQREPFDYTQWRRGLWPEKSIEEISEAAMELRRECEG